jgi:hypothetical protein
VSGSDRRVNREQAKANSLAFAAANAPREGLGFRLHRRF